MTAQNTNDNERASELIQEIFNLWTIIVIGDEGKETRSPGSEEELIASRKILSQISELEITDEELLNFCGEYADLLDEYEEGLAYNKTDNGRAALLLEEIFNLWSVVSMVDDDEMHKPSNDEEVAQSWALIRKIEDLNFDEERVSKQLNSYKEVLQSYANDKAGGPAGKGAENYDLAWEKLGEIFSLWSDISIKDGNELRSPANKKEIKKSRALMREVLALKVSEQDVLQRINELEGVISSTDAYFPKYTGRIIKAIIISLVFIVGLYFYLTQDTYETPQINYEEEWFVTKKGGYLLWDAFISDKDLPEVKQKIYLKKGTQLTPIAQIGNWVQVETADGQRGLLDPLILNGSKYVVAKSGAKVYKKIGSDKIDTIPEGTAGIIIDRHTNKDHVIWKRYLKIKFDDGKIRWARDYDFKQLMMESLPEIEQLYYHTTNASMFQKLAIGKPLPEFEKHYGPATSILKVNGKHQAFFRHVYVMDEGRLYKGVLVNLDYDNVALDIEYITNGWKRTYEIFPLVTTMRDTEIQKGGMYRKEVISIEWWEDFKDMNWFTWIIGWVVKIALILIVLFLYFSVPRFIIFPIMQIFAYNKVFSNGIVNFINAIILMLVYYLFFVLSILIIDQWFIPAVGSVVLCVLWILWHFKNIKYNRCPMCNVMYSALNEGSTYRGRETNVTRGTWEKDKGTSSYISGKTKYITHHSEIRDKKTTEHVDSYLDHRMCALCGYQWDVDRTETEEHTVHY